MSELRSMMARVRVIVSRGHEYSPVTHQQRVLCEELVRKGALVHDAESDTFKLKEGQDDPSL